MILYFNTRLSKKFCQNFALKRQIEPENLQAAPGEIIPRKKASYPFKAAKTIITTSIDEMIAFFSFKNKQAIKKQTGTTIPNWRISTRPMEDRQKKKIYFVFLVLKKSKAK